MSDVLGTTNRQYTYWKTLSDLVPPQGWTSRDLSVWGLLDRSAWREGPWSLPGIPGRIGQFEYHGMLQFGSAAVRSVDLDISVSTRLAMRPMTSTRGNVPVFQ